MNSLSIENIIVYISIISIIKELCCVTCQIAVVFLKKIIEIIAFGFHSHRKYSYIRFRPFGSAMRLSSIQDLVTFKVFLLLDSVFHGDRILLSHL